jgi:hypothetical protein
MNTKVRNRITVAVLVAAGLAATAYYLHNKRQQELSVARANAFAICSFASSAAVDAMSINDTELPAIAAKAGLDPNKVRLGMVSPEEGQAALSSAGLLGEWNAVLTKTRAMVEEAKAKDIECNKRQENAIKFFERE